MRTILAIIFMTFGLGACVQNNTGGQAGPQLLRVMESSKKNCNDKGFESGTSQWSVCYEKELAEGKRKEFGVGGFSEPPPTKAELFCAQFGFDKNHKDLPNCKLVYFQNQQNQQNMKRIQSLQFWSGIQQAGQALQQGNNQNTNLGSSITGHLNCTVQPNGKQLYCW